MIHRLEMKGYRGFERYTLANLSRVNLLVGRNNSGKSSILEAVQLLADGGSLRALDEIAGRRGETLAPDPSSGSTRPGAEVSHFFHGHEIKAGSSFLITRMSNETDQYGPRVEGYRDFVITTSDQCDSEEFAEKFVDLGALDGGDLIIKVEGHERSGGDSVAEFAYLSDDGTLELRRAASRSSRFTLGFGPRRIVRTTLFVSPDSLDRHQLAEFWDHIITDGDEDEVVRAMQILEPDLTSIAFLSGDRSSSSDPRGGVVVGFRGESRRRPLGSHGEGMRRLLTLAVALARTKDGVLLIDEVDTGLHYSILGDVWSLIVETAVRNNVQVFLTTHSLDCLRALAWFCGARPDLADQISVQKIERRLDEAVAFEASEIQIAIEQDIEVR